MFGNDDGGHIGTASGVLMIAVAAVIDGIQFLLTLILIGFLVNPIISLVATMLFGIWLSHNGVSMMAPKYAARFLLTILGETVFGTLPIWTFSIAFIVGESKLKEVVNPPSPRGRGGFRL